MPHKRYAKQSCLYDHLPVNMILAWFAFITCSQSAQGLRHQHETNVKDVQKILVVAGHRTGSTMLMNLINNYPGTYSPNWEKERVMLDNGNKYGFYSPNEPYTGLGVGRGPCRVKNLTLDECFNYYHSFSPNASRIVFKIEWDTFKDIPGGLASPNITYVQHLRRNVLRTMAAFPSGQHPQSVERADEANFKTALDSASLISTIKDFFSLHAAIPEMIGQRPMCASRFEDWIDPRARRLQERRIEKCLGLPPMGLSEQEVGIQERFPILETIANGEEVKNALQGTEFEYMLEDAALDPRPATHASQVEYGFLDDASRDIVFDKLKNSERFYAKGFEAASEWPNILDKLSASDLSTHRVGSKFKIPFKPK